MVVGIGLPGRWNGGGGKGAGEGAGGGCETEQSGCETEQWLQQYPFQTHFRLKTIFS